MTRTISRGRLGLLAVLVMAAAFTIKPATAFPPSGPPVFEGGPTNFITMSDGTSIAANVVVPDKCKPGAPDMPAGGCPAILEMAGYENGSSDNDTLINGPILVNLFAQSTANDTEFMVQIADRYPDGTVAILQRGLLKASHRAVDPLRSDYDEAHDDFMYRPFHPHTNPTDITPGDTNEYQIEIFPVAWPFLKGHQIQIKIMAPTAVDNYYSYAPKTMPLALNTVLFGGATPSRITLPVIPWVSLAETNRACTWYVRIRCVKD